jgi:nucleoside phosphorylase
MPASCDVLVVAAFQPELAAMRALLGDGMAARVGDLDVAARVVGIGLSAASAGTATCAGVLRPRAVVLVGTCGAYVGTGLAIGEVAVARRVRLASVADAMGWAAFPEPMSIATDANAPLAEALEASGGRSCNVATTLALTTANAVAARVAQATDCHVEHLEAHGVATACASLGVPFAAALGVANFVGASARDEWRAHHRDAACRVADLVIRWLRDGARGVARASRA